MAGLVAGALSMAAGEYVSVSSQADTERADVARERTELATAPVAEEEELTGIYIGRGLDPALARTVAQQLMARDALRAHARDELGLSDEFGARPLQAALASAATFAVMFRNAVSFSNCDRQRLPTNATAVASMDAIQGTYSEAGHRATARKKASGTAASSQRRAGLAALRRR